MSCCGKHGNGKGGQDHNQVKRSAHQWMMMLCCILPIVIVGVLLFTNAAAGSLGGSAWIMAMLLICPLAHLVLMPLLMKKK